MLSRDPAPTEEPLFLERGLAAVANALLRDLASFTLVLLYYLVLWIVGAPLLLLDKRLGTGLFDRLIRFAERLDR